MEVESPVTGSKRKAENEADDNRPVRRIRVCNLLPGSKSYGAWDSVLTLCLGP